jgi:adenosylmethionine---8-amino-7-oxononanoate aminotransferase
MDNVTLRDLKTIWHPLTQMHGMTPPPAISHGEGAVLVTTEGKRLIDGISSWWINIHGHGNSFLADALTKQARAFSQAIFANFTHEPAVELAERLCAMTAGSYSRVFYTGDGSSAVEAALKMAVQYWSNRGTPRKKIIALHNGYHGDTFGAMSAGARNHYTAPFADLLFDVDFITPEYIPTPSHVVSEVSGGNTPNWDEILSEDVAAVIFEPILQCAGGMLMYSAEWLESLLAAARRKNILTIADEIATGFGRTGRLFACEYIQTQPDIMCVSKAITSGTLPLAAVLTTENIFETFLSEDRAKMFLHSHSYCGNALACAVACASLTLLQKPETHERIKHISRSHQSFLDKIQNSPIVHNCRALGTVAAFEVGECSSTYMSSIRDVLMDFFLERGVFLRPLGNTIYIFPPYVISDTELDRVYEVVEEALTFLSAEGLPT